MSYYYTQTKIEIHRLQVLVEITGQRNNKPDRINIGGGPENIIHGAGDLYVTVFGGRTRKIGTLLGRGLTFDQAMEELKGVTLESIVIATRTARAVKKLAARGVVSLDDYPLLMHVDEIINQGAEVNIPWEKFIMCVEK